MSQDDAVLRKLPVWMTVLSGVALGLLVLGLVLPRVGRGGGGGGDEVSGMTGGMGGAGGSQLGEVFWSAPEFSLVDQGGEGFGSEALAGQVWVAEFFFTHCPGICPVLSLNMQDLYAEVREQPWAESVRLVSFSLDPERDTPAVLAEYAEAIGAEAEGWVFLTGSREALWRVSESGFRLAVSENPEDPRNPIAHTGKLVLVDRAGRIRGFYDGLSPGGMALLRADLERVVKDG